MPDIEIPEEDLIDENIYIVVEVGWEYDDSNYYRPESMGSHPNNAFTIKKLADEYCNNKNYEWFVDALKSKYTNPADFISSWNVDSNYLENVVDEVQYLFVIGWKLHSEDPHLLKQNQVLKLIDEFGINQYEVVAVKLTA